MSYANIFEALKTGTVEDVKFFIEKKGVNVKMKDDNPSWGWTPLHYAAAKDNSNVEVLKYLVSQGADVNAKSNSGKTPLHIAAQFNTNVEVFKYLISQGSNVNARSNDGFTPLFIAVSNNNVEAVQILVSAGADVNERLNDGNIPMLSNAVAFGNANIDIVKLLVSAGADVNAKDDNGLPPLDMANPDNQAIIEYLSSMGAKRRRDM